MRRAGLKKLFLSIFSLAFLFPSLSEACNDCDPGPYVVQTNDKWIPNFDHDIYNLGPVVESGQNGFWSQPATWLGGVVPGPGSRVRIRHLVRIDSAAAARVVTLHTGGELQFRTDTNTSLTVTTLQVFRNGQLTVGTLANPVMPDKKAEIIFRNEPLDLVKDPGQYSNGLLAYGKVTMYGAERAPTFTRLAAEPLAGQTQLTLDQSATGWQIGDRLILPGTAQYHERNSQHQWEELTVTGLSLDGQNRTVVNFSPALAYDHKGAYDANGVLTFLPHVGNLTRNVVVRSENPDGVRGHIFSTNRADVDIRHARFTGLGRTTMADLDSTTWDAAGSMTHLGTNQQGRYAVHFHHLLGPETAQANGHSFTFCGSAIEDSTYWPMTIHNSHYGLFCENVVYNGKGWGLGTELGTESFNVIEKNFVVRIQGRGGREDSPGNTGAAGYGIWLRGPNNYLRNNVVANTGPNHSIDLYFGLAGVAKVPAYAGADPSIAGQDLSIDFGKISILDISDNEVYSTWGGGFSIWDHFPENSSTIDGLVTWHCGGNLIYPKRRVIFDRFTMFGDCKVLSDGFSMANGLDFGDYHNEDVIVRNGNFQCLRNAIQISNATGGGKQIVENSYIRCHIGVAITGAQGSSGVGMYQLPKTTIIRNVKFDIPSAPPRNDMGPPYTIAAGWAGAIWGVDDAIQRDDIFVYKYNQTPGDDFRVYYFQQLPDAITTFSSPNRRGSPERFVTNTLNLQRYGITTAGSIPTSNETRDKIYGIVGPLPNDPPLGLPPRKTVIFNLDTTLFKDADGTFTARWIWGTNTPSTTEIRDTGQFDSERFTGAYEHHPVKLHSLDVPGFKPGKVYQYWYTSRNADGVTEDRWGLWVPEIDPAKDTSNAGFHVQPGVVYVAPDNASVAMDTYELTEVLVEFGPTTGYGQSAVENGFHTGHLVRLLGLTPGQTYHCRVRAKDAAGNEIISNDMTFTTPAVDNGNPAISNISVADLTSNSATLLWKTSEDTSAFLDYGLTASYGEQTGVDTLKRQDHRTFLVNLTPGTPYHYRITVRDAQGNSTSSGDLTFTTLNNPANEPPSVQTPAAVSPDPVPAKTAALTVLGSDDGGEPNLIYVWSTIGNAPGQVTFSPNRSNAAKNTTATFTRAGRYTLQATIKDEEGSFVTSSVQVTVNQTFTSVVVSPNNDAVAIHGTKQFFASARDQFNHSMVNQPTFSWAVDGGGVIDNTGLFNAGASVGGPFTVTATGSGKSGTAHFTVTLNKPPAINILSPANNARFPAPADIQLTAGASDVDGQVKKVEFYADNAFLGSVPSAPYIYDWTNVPANTYVVTARAVDDQDAGTTSLPINVTVDAQGGQDGNQAPFVNGGPDQTILMPMSVHLTGVAGDDGLPVNPGVLLINWTKVSGPGRVTFSPANAAVTHASFSTAGPYKLRITASDGQLSASDDVAINVLLPNGQSPFGSSTRVIGNIVRPADGVSVFINCSNGRIIDGKGHKIMGVTQPSEWGGRNARGQMVASGTYELVCTEDGNKGTDILVVVR